jgi:predicted PurR-regulated permease PerM
MPSSKQIVEVRFSISNLLTVTAFALGIVAIFYLHEVIMSLFVAVILMSAISPLVGIIRRYLKVSTIAAVAIAYVIAMVSLGILIVLVIPPLFHQVSLFLEALPTFAQNALASIGIPDTNVASLIESGQFIPLVSDRAGQVAQGALSITVFAFSSLIGTVSIAVFTFYLLLEKEYVEGALIQSLPFIKPRQKKRFLLMFEQIQNKLGYWARGQLMLCFIIGLCTYIGLLLLQVEYALPLAVIAGILEIIPTIGPIVSAVPTVIVVLAVDPPKALFIIALYLIIQQLENSLIVPQVMKKAVGFSPLITILAIMIGGKLLGISGALLAVPFTAATFVVLDYIKKNQEIINKEIEAA